jgi:hypothetical protein
VSKFFQQEGKAMKLQEKTESNFRSRKAERDTTESSLQEAGLESNSAIDSLVRRVRHRQNRLQVLFLGIKLGIPGSEKALNNALFRYGDVYMALDYLNCGSPELDKGGGDSGLTLMAIELPGLSVDWVRELNVQEGLNGVNFSVLDSH